MFRFQAFHMYGIIGLAVAIGIPVVAITKAKQLKDYSGQKIVFKSKSWSIPRYLICTIFGLGWALSGACPGPIVVNMGVGYLGYAVVLVSAVWELTYGVIRDKLPH